MIFIGKRVLCMQRRREERELDMSEKSENGKLCLQLIVFGSIFKLVCSYFT